MKRDEGRGQKPTKLPARRAAMPATPARSSKAPGRIDEAALLGDLRTLVQSARQRIAVVAYSTQTMPCWQMGRRLSKEHLQGGRAAYGKQILVTVSRELTAEFRPGLNSAAPTRMAHAVVRMTSPGDYLYCRGLEVLGRVTQDVHL